LPECRTERRPAANVTAQDFDLFAQPLDLGLKRIPRVE
jgi:hypothetical protein